MPVPHRLQLERENQFQTPNSDYNIGSTDDKYWLFSESLNSNFSVDWQSEFCSSFENSVVVSNLSVKGRLKDSYAFWKDTLCADNDILTVIRDGYVIPFRVKPPSFVMRNNRSALSNSDFVESAIQDLLTKHCAYEVPFIPHNVNPLSVAINNSSGKKRLILDFSVLNTYIKRERVKFEDFKVALEYIVPNGYMFKFDLTSGYHHFSISPIHHSYLGFSWIINGAVKYFVFSVLAFGLTSAPFLFTKGLRPLVKYWRGHGLKIIIFLDDGWGINRSFETASSDAQFVLDTLQKAGFLVNIDKSILVHFSVWSG